MPASREAVQLTNRYRQALLVMRERTARFAASAWLTLSLSDLDGSHAAWAASTEAAVEGAKRTGVQLTDAYLAGFVAAELGRAPRPQGLDPEGYLDTEDGRPLDRALATPLMTVKAGLAVGREDALRLGLVRATRIVAEEVLAAPRRALGDAMKAETWVVGWRRVVGSRPCGACLANAKGGVHDTDEPFRRHGSCRCVREPVVRGAVERYRRPTGREIFDSLAPGDQAALFHGRGGEEKAELIRSGAVPLDALVKRERQEVTPDQFTEASLGDLRALANRPG